MVSKARRGLAGAGQAGDDHQLVARDLDVDVLEVVLARAAHDDLFRLVLFLLGHGVSPCLRL